MLRVLSMVKHTQHVKHAVAGVWRHAPCRKVLKFALLIESRVSGHSLNWKVRSNKCCGGYFCLVLSTKDPKLASVHSWWMAIHPINLPRSVPGKGYKISMYTDKNSLKHHSCIKCHVLHLPKYDDPYLEKGWHNIRATNYIIRIVLHI